MRRRAQPLHFSTIILYVLFCLATSPFSVSAGKDLPPMEYVYPDQSVWTTKRAVDGKLKNPLLHFAEALFSESGISWSAEPYPANRVFLRLEKGQSNFSILVRAPRLRESCIFSIKPITYIELRVYRSKATSAIRSPEDLNDKEVITVLGYSYGQLGNYLNNPENRITRYTARQHKSAFRMLALGRADYLLDYAGPSEEILSEQAIPEITYDVFKRVNVYLVLSKNYPNAQQVMDKLENIAQSIDITQWGLATP